MLFSRLAGVTQRAGCLPPAPTYHSLTFERDGAQTKRICRTNFTAQKDLVPLNLMSAAPPPPGPIHPKPKSPNSVLSAASWHRLYLAGLSLQPVSVRCANATTARHADLAAPLWLVSPLACARLPVGAVCTLLGFSNQRPEPVQPLIQPRALPHQLSVITRLIHRRTGGRQSVTDVFCATMNELPGDQGRWWSGRLSMKGP